MSTSKKTPISNQKAPGGNWPSKQPGKTSGNKRAVATPASKQANR